MIGTRQRSSKWFIPYCLIGALLGIILTSSYSAAAQRYSTSGDVNYGEQFQLILDTIRSNHVNPKAVESEEKLFNIAIDAILKEIGDKHGSYFSAEEYRQFNEGSRPTNYTGVGISIGAVTDGVIILGMFDNSPLKNMSIRIGDVITAAGSLGEPMTHWSRQLGNINEMVDAIRGPVGSDVNLKIKRGTTDIGIITVPRIHTRNQFVYMNHSDAGILTIRITEFSATVYNDIKRQLSDNGWLGRNDVVDTSIIKGVVLDLRNNPGGLLGEAIRVSDLFLPKGVPAVQVIEPPEVEGGPAQAFNYITQHVRTFPKIIPRVILVNGGSASASEIVAGAAQAHKEAIILGVKSYGKGSVQTISPLPGGAAIKTTTAIYLAGGSMEIDGIGVTPEMVVLQPDVIGMDDDSRQFNNHLRRISMDREIDHQLNVAHTYIEFFISGAHVLDSPDSQREAQNKAHGATTNLVNICEEKGFRGCPPVDITLLNGMDENAAGWVYYPEEAIRVN